jgi:hypothetical protein
VCPAAHAAGDTAALAPRPPPPLPTPPPGVNPKESDPSPPPSSSSSPSELSIATPSSSRDLSSALSLSRACSLARALLNLRWISSCSATCFISSSASVIESVTAPTKSESITKAVMTTKETKKSGAAIQRATGCVHTGCQNCPLSAMNDDSAAPIVYPASMFATVLLHPFWLMYMTSLQSSSVAVRKSVSIETARLPKCTGSLG